MSKKHNNYNKMFDNEVKPEVIEEPSFESASKDEIVEEVSPEVVKFGVVNCERLNVRQTPVKDGNILMVLKRNDKIIIKVDESTEDFYKVEIKIADKSVNGYCVKEFIDAE